VFTGACSTLAASFPSRIRCRPSPCVRLSRTPTTTTAPPHPARSADGVPIPPTTPECAAGGNRSQAVPVFTGDRSISRHPAVPLRHRHEYAVDLPRGLRAEAPRPASEFSIPRRQWMCAASGPHPPGSSRRGIEGVNTGSSRMPLHLASRTQTIWQCWPVPALSGLLPPSPAPPGSGCPQLRCPATTRPTVQVFHLHSVTQRLTAHEGSALRTSRASLIEGLTVTAGGAWLRW
jgi:hypothetical protein